MRFRWKWIALILVFVIGSAGYFINWIALLKQRAIARWVPGPLVSVIQRYELWKLLNGLDQPVEFRGVLQDQFGAGLSRVEVDYNIKRSLKDFIIGRVQTDAKGYFEITGKKGLELNLTPKIEGYTFIGPATFKPWNGSSLRYYGSKTNPEIVRIWKLMGPERLVYYYGWHDVSFDKREIQFDTLRSRLVETGGDFKLSVEYETEMRGPHEVYGCQYLIEPIDGEIQTVPENVHWWTLLAPAVGYTNVIRGHVQPGSSAHSEHVFLISRNRKVFSRAKITVFAPGGRDGRWQVRVDALVNGNGSGNWEVDWSKVDRTKLYERAIIDATGIISHDLENVSPQ
jgi:hypothetical protein